MVWFTAPAFLAAGALVALAPLVLHMLARTPPERRPLPTARFLEPDPRTRLRLRRPADLLLLALRMGFVLLLGAAFARPVWVPDREGAGRVVLLDTGAGMASAWGEAIAAAADRLGADGTLVVFDTAARVLDDGARSLDSLAASGPAGAPSSYLAALRGLRLAAGSLRVDSAAAVLITRPRWSAWSPALWTAREAAWPARLELVALGADAPPPPVPDRDPSAGSATVIGPAAHPLRPFAAAALTALGYEVVDEGARLGLVLPGAGDAAAELLEGLRGAVLLGRHAEDYTGAAWSGAAGRGDVSPRWRGRLVLPGGRSMDGWGSLGGRPAADARVLAVWEDGRPAAAAAMTGDRCTAYVAAEPAARGAAADPVFPHLIDALAEGCAPARAPRQDGLGDVGLDAGAMATLTRDTLPRTAELSSFGGEDGRPLTGILLALALAVAMAELGVGYAREAAA